MAFDSAKTALADVESKLRKFFGLAGTIGAKFSPDGAPTFVLGDARDPGLATFRGRKWAWVSDEYSGARAAADAVGFAWGSPVIIHSVYASWGGGFAAGDRLELFLLTPDDAALAVWVANRSSGTWVDQKTVATEAAPLFDRAAPVAAVTPTNLHLKRVGQWSLGTANGDFTQPLRDCGRFGWHATANSALLWRFPAATAGTRFTVGAFGEMA